jgi:uncharacterized protein (TIGR02246 family)
MADRDRIEELLESYRSAVHAKDADAFLALYDPNVRVFDMWGRWSYDGIDEWRQMVTGWFGSLGNERVAVDLHQVHTITGDDLAAAHVFVTFRGLSPEGKELRAMDNRLTWVLRKTGVDRWKVVHEHSSAPIEFDTTRPVLRR